MTHTWNVAIRLFDADDVEREGMLTAAHAVLSTSSGTSLEGHGRALRNPQDPQVREIGEELAAAVRWVTWLGDACPRRLRVHVRRHEAGRAGDR